jgi:hypothetical protein
MAIGISLVASLAPLMQEFAGFVFRQAEFPNQDDRQLEAVTIRPAVTLALLGRWLVGQPCPSLLDPFRDADVNLGDGRFMVGLILKSVPEVVPALVRKPSRIVDGRDSRISWVQGWDQR